MKLHCGVTVVMTAKRLFHMNAAFLRAVIYEQFAHESQRKFKTIIARNEDQSIMTACLLTHFGYNLEGKDGKYLFLVVFLFKEFFKKTQHTFC